MDTQTIQTVVQTTQLAQSIGRSDPRLELFVEAYVRRGSTVLQACSASGIMPEEAAEFVNRSWFRDRVLLKKHDMYRDQARDNLAYFLSEMPVNKAIFDREGVEVSSTLSPELLRIKAEMTKFALETLDSEHHSKKVVHDDTMTISISDKLSQLEGQRRGEVIDLDSIGAAEGEFEKC